jgi:hypothetical protein
MEFSLVLVFMSVGSSASNDRISIGRKKFETL